VKTIRAKADALYAEAGPNQRNRVVSAYPSKRRAIAGRSDLPPGLLELGEKLYRHVSRAGFQTRLGVEDATKALLYLIHSIDEIPDREAPGGLGDDFAYLLETCAALRL
jgi:hypothetical protein